MNESDIRKRLNAASKAVYDRDARIHETPVTKRELDAREARRATPKLEATLTPSGSVTREVQASVEAENERRIHFIKKRLERQKGRLGRDFTRER